LRELIRKAGKLLLLIRVPLFRRGLWRGRVAAGIEHKAVLTTREIDLVVDVGANRGQFSLAVRRWQPRAEIVAFEPLSGPADKYERLFAGDSRVRLHRIAIAPAAGRMPMHISGSEDASSLLAIGALQAKHFPGTRATDETMVDAAPLTDFVDAKRIAKSALLKIDVQGFELEVLKACGALLPLFSWIYVEASFVPLYDGQSLVDEVIAHLDRAGFKLAGVFNLQTTAEERLPLQADFLFERREMDTAV